MKRLIPCWVAVLATLPFPAHAGMENAYDKTTDQKKIAVMDKGKAAIQSKLKHPESAKFRNVFFHSGIDNVAMTCGEISFRNAQGKQTRFQKFMSAGRPEYAYLQQDLKDFEPTWRQFCQ